MNTIRNIQPGSADNSEIGNEIVQRDNSHKKPDVSKVSQQVLKEAAHSIDVAINVPLDKEYFSNPENVRRDLEAFMQAYNLTVEGKYLLDSISEMTTASPSIATEILLPNGRIVTWGTYQHMCSRVMTGKGQVIAIKEMPTRAVVTHLLTVVGVLFLDREYFNNPEYVRSDLEAFKVAYNECPKTKYPLDSIAEITTTSPWSDTEITLLDGRKMNWGTYMRTCSSALVGMSKLAAVREMSPGSVVKYLLTLLEVEFLDSDYFNNSSNLIRDLEAFRTVYNLSVDASDAIVSIADVTTSTPSPETQIVLQDGRKITWHTYVSVYIRAITGKPRKQAYRDLSKSDAVRCIKDLAGCLLASKLEISKSYFENLHNIKRDLELFLVAYNTTATKRSYLRSVSEMTTHRPNGDTKITMHNGAEITWGTYLTTCSRMVTGKGKEEAVKEMARSAALNYLRRIAEYNVLLLDKSYFENPEKVRRDLELFLEAYNEKVESSKRILSIADMNTSSANDDVSINLTDGSGMTWSAYLQTCRRALTGKSNLDSMKDLSLKDTLAYMKELVGAKEQYLDKAYFEDPVNVQRDLELFIESYNKTVEGDKQLGNISEIVTIKPSANTRITLPNGKSITWITYLLTCGAVRSGKSQRAARNEVSLTSTINYLKEVLGIKIQESIEFTKEHFNSSEEVRHILEMFLIANNETVEQCHYLKDIFTVTTYKPKMNTVITFPGGGEISWERYLKTCSKVLTGKSTRVSLKEMSFASVINHLKLVALSGVESSWIDEL